MKAFTDIHHHLLYGIDDGPRAKVDMYDMLDAAGKQRITDIIVTPHATPGVHRFDTKQFKRALTIARTYIDVAGLDIHLHPGCEILYTQQTTRLLKDGVIPTLDDSRYVLVEFSPDDSYNHIYKALEDILSNGYLPILAHVERYACLTRSAAKAIQMKEEFGLDVYYQVNSATIVEDKGFKIRRFISEMLEEQMIDAVATDAHNVTSRPVRLREAYQILEERYGKSYATQLTNGSVLRNMD